MTERERLAAEHVKLLVPGEVGGLCILGNSQVAREISVAFINFCYNFEALRGQVFVHFVQNHDSVDSKVG